MERRAFLKRVAIGTVAIGIAQEVSAAEKYFPTKVDPGLFETINRIKDPANKTGLEKTHAPAITAPAKIKMGEPFTVGVSVGESAHVMTSAHWIEYIQLDIGNEPAGRIEFQANGFAVPKVVFTVALKEAPASGKVTLIAHQRCNLHGYWEGSMDVTVA
jgi:superoxide reductase